ncbi:MAG: MipA/OmpV family protein, partial [Desulfobacca sp.]|nr:MipA/OmpV family protein [Desulfobacca sp.]
MIKHIFLSIALFLSLALFIPGPAHCKQYPLWEAGLGGVFLYMPDYRGSDESRGHVFAFPYMIYRGDWLKIDRESIRG